MRWIRFKGDRPALLAMGCAVAGAFWFACKAGETSANPAPASGPVLTNLPAVTRPPADQPPVGLASDTHLDKIPPRATGLTRGIVADYVFECTGQPKVWEEAVQYVRRGGAVVLFGGCPPGATVTYHTQRLHYDEITLKGVFHYTPEDVRTAAGLLARLPLVVQLISGRFTLDKLADAFEKLSQGEGIKYAITP